MLRCTFTLEYLIFLVLEIRNHLVFTKMWGREICGWGAGGGLETFWLIRVLVVEPSDLNSIPGTHKEK